MLLSEARQAGAKRPFHISKGIYYKRNSMKIFHSKTSTVLSINVCYSLFVETENQRKDDLMY